MYPTNHYDKQKQHNSKMGKTHTVGDMDKNVDSTVVPSLPKLEQTKGLSKVEQIYRLYNISENQ